MRDEQLLETLKAILLEDERELNNLLRNELEFLKEELMETQKLGEKVEPHIEEKIVYLKENFSTLFGDEVTASIKYQIANSRDEVIDALYPIIGKLIRRFIAAEIAALSEKVDRQISTTFSADTWMRRIKGFFSGADAGDVILAETAAPEIQEVFVIQKNSGLLLGSYSKNKLADRDMIAGMLTAIISFAEDAFAKGNNDLETIDYVDYELLIYNFHSFYMAVSVSGTLNQAFKNELGGKMLDFAGKHMKDHVDEVNSDVVDDISGKLEKEFKS